MFKLKKVENKRTTDIKLAWNDLRVTVEGAIYVYTSILIFSRIAQNNVNLKLISSLRRYSLVCAIFNAPPESEGGVVVWWCGDVDSWTRIHGN